MRENICLQCKKTCFGPINRLVQDACGHKKCRTCLLADEQQCSQCDAENPIENGIENEQQLESEIINCDRNGEINKQVVLSNHTAVIQVNGGYPKVKRDSVKVAFNSIIDDENDVVDSIKPVVDDMESSLKDIKLTEDKFKIKKPDKSAKKAHNPIDIPKHIDVISDPLSYHCTICDKTFVTKTHVKYHSYCLGGAKPFKCEVCQKEFILRAQLDVHSYKHKSSKPFSCSICKKSFNARSKLTRHSAVHSAVKSHICAVCGSAYRSKESLKIHLIIHKGEKPYGCKLCSAKFNNQSNLNKHVATHSKEKTHMCDQCGKRFKQKWALSIHRRSHSRMRPHECGMCHKAFVNLKDLQRHSFVHAESKAYSCSICSLSFRRSDNLRRHMKNTHPGKNGRVIKNPVTPPQVTVAIRQNNIDTSSSQPVDNPNAINVIMTASAPSSAFCKAEVALQVLQQRQQRFELLENPHQEPVASLVSLPQSDCRASSNKNSDNGADDDVTDTPSTPGSYANADATKRSSTATTQQRSATSGVINGPIKLAFKTPAFKSSYNINRNFNYIPTTQHQKSTYDMAESVNICQKILSTSSTPVVIPQPSRNIICRVEPRPPTSEEICQKILDPNSEPKIHYETSFQNRKHAMIKNIKFKVPAKYTSKFRESNNVADKSTMNSNNNIINNNNTENIVQDKNYFESVAATSVIVNNSVQFSNSMEHWRRRTSQNLGLKN